MVKGLQKPRSLYLKKWEVSFFPLCECFHTEIQCFIQFMLNKIQWLESEVEWDQIEKHKVVNAEDE